MDRLNSNPIEINAKNGIISKIGKQRKVGTPINDIIVTLQVILIIGVYE